jgi:hypothetical protein
MPKSTPASEPETALAVVTPSEARAAVRNALERITVADEDPTPRMASFILSHPPEEWDELWSKVPNVRDNAGRKVRIHTLRVRESDYEGPFGLYLIADVTWLDTGEADLLSCSSQMSIVQLVKLYMDGKLPADVEIVAKDKPTRRGFRPIHLRYLSPGQAALGDPGAVVSTQ